MSDVRRRRPAPSASGGTDGFVPGAGLSAKAMVDASPQQHGVVLKLHIPVFFNILPSFAKKMILGWSFLSCLAPSWKKRYLVLCGSYLYKFVDVGSVTPKGSPFDIETLTTDVIRTPGRDDADVSYIDCLPTGYTGIFVVSTLRRRHYYAVPDNEEASMWVRSLHEARQEAITRNMGHASHVPYPFSWKHFDSLGKGLLKSKNRIRERMEMSSLEGMEMTAFSDGQVSRGYYG